MQTGGSGPESPLTAIFATLPATVSGHPGNLRFILVTKLGLKRLVRRRFRNFDCIGERIGCWENSTWGIPDDLGLFH